MECQWQEPEHGVRFFLPFFFKMMSATASNPEEEKLDQILLTF